MRGTAEFQIIGRIGRIATVGSTLKINIASDYPRTQASRTTAPGTTTPTETP